MKTAARPTRHRQAGFSLLEVMVAGVIMSSGLAGIAALLLSAVAGTSASADRSHAVMLADNMINLVGLSPDDPGAFLQPPGIPAMDCNFASGCSSAQFASHGLRAWQAQVASYLPGGQGTVCRDNTPHDGSRVADQCDGSGPIYIKIFWEPRPGSADSQPRLVQRVP